MSLMRKISARAEANTNTGFGTNPGSYGGRFINKDGSANISKRGMNWLARTSWYHTMISMPRWKFMFILFAFYALVNFIFAGLYFLIGVEYLDGIGPTGSTWIKFGKAYFFSAQTFTTVGYGHISPNGVLTSSLAATEALVGLLSFAIATGLFFGRFSRPVAHILFSHHALVSPYRGGKALMMRLTPYKNTDFSEALVKITLGMSVEENGKMVNKFYNLPLELNTINRLTLSWTLVHPMTEDSPLYGFTADDFRNIEGEIMVHVQTFDDLFSTQVVAKTSYTFDEVVYGAKFRIMYSENEANTKTILHLDKLDTFDLVAFE